MKRIKMSLVTAMLSMAVLSIAAQSGRNIVYQEGEVRITLITAGAVRLEWQPSGAQFIDNRSQVAVNRDYPAVPYQIKESKSQVTISTSCLVLQYKKGSGPFSEKNLTIKSAKGMLPFTWQPGLPNEGNLKGTSRTLDGYDGNFSRYDKKPLQLEDGLLSTQGWSLIDDSHSYLFDNSDWPWVAERPATEGQDWYFLAYGHNYKQALRDYTLFAGKVPLPPRYAFGYWWSRYWSYSDSELRNLVDNFHTYNIPLDVLVIDMDWHYTEAGKGGWTGYTWNRRLFPHPDAFLKYLKKNDLQITLNLHPADGVAPYETHYSDLARYMGEQDTTRVIPYEGSNKQFMSGWMSTILRPMEQAGIDFWWLDWQQWRNDKRLKDLSNTWWINYVVFSDMQRNRDSRPLLYHRWGGLGNHRYQVGFSGDTYISWASLNYQPYFNSTASNVLYGYWSHDIGGHMGADSINPEMYIRWMQFGALSPILRTHSTKQAGLNKEPWVFPQEKMEIIRATVQERYRLAPYIYTMARKCYDVALSLCRPMYYDYPDDGEAYANPNEYMFGDNLLVYPITAPMQEGRSRQTVWLPQGSDWVEWCSGTLLKGGQKVERSFTLDEYPLYVKAGSLLPLYGDGVKNLRGNDEAVMVTLFPGGTESHFDMYEDAGNSKDYDTQYATTHLAMQRNANEVTVTIAARQGDYAGMPSQRAYSLHVIASAMPQQVTVNGHEVPFTYDGNALTLQIAIPEQSCAVEKVVKVIYPNDAPNVADGLLAQMRHLRRAVLDYKRGNAGVVWNEEIGSMESTALALGYYPQEFAQRVALFRSNYARLDKLLDEQKMEAKEKARFLHTAQ